jgi:hypothetical protein
MIAIQPLTGLNGPLRYSGGLPLHGGQACSGPHDLVRRSWRSWMPAAELNPNRPGPQNLSWSRPLLRTDRARARAPPAAVAYPAPWRPPPSPSLSPLSSAQPQQPDPDPAPAPRHVLRIPNSLAPSASASPRRRPALPLCRTALPSRT